MEITIKTPEGNYCEDCKFLNLYSHRLVDMFGNETGNVREGYKCKYFNIHLEEEVDGCFEKVKKCYACKLDNKQAVDGYYMLMLLSMHLGSKNEK